ncbi:MAG: hypothetical protein J6W09_08235, partial [Bacteroidales bacterium]|nr:hypothetical protein [Bacteroidales bacterium]
MTITIIILALCIVLLAIGLLFTLLRLKGAKPESKASNNDNAKKQKPPEEEQESVSETDRELFVRCC